MKKADIHTYPLADRSQLVGEHIESYQLRVRDLPAADKPREKLMAAGAKALSSHELMAVLLNVGTKKEDVLAMAQRITKEYGQQAIISETDPAKLGEVLDVPLGKACQIVAAFELGRRFFSGTSGKPLTIRNDRQAFRHCRDMGALKKEQLKGLYLGSRYQLVHEEVISIGTLTSNLVHAREVFAPAIEHSAVAVIIAHNHPSGILEPTKEDIETTLQLVDAGNILGIDLIDHLIIAGERYVSLSELIKDHA